MRTDLDSDVRRRTRRSDWTGPVRLTVRLGTGQTGTGRVKGVKTHEFGTSIRDQYLNENRTSRHEQRASDSELELK
jgi:hypothetical protein